MKLIAATPIEYKRGTSFVTRARGCGIEDVRVPSYRISVEARGLAELRKQLGLGLRDAAIKIGIKAIELSGLERGQLVPSDEKDWFEMAKALKKTGGTG